MLNLAVSSLGHVTRLAHDGATAVALARQFGPDVIFLDIGLPVMNGYAVARTLRDLPEFSHVYIAAVTGWGQEEDRRKAREAGFDSHFTKPLSPDVLEDVLGAIAQRMVSGRGRQQHTANAPHGFAPRVLNRRISARFCVERAQRTQLRSPAGSPPVAAASTRNTWPGRDTSTQTQRTEPRQEVSDGPDRRDRADLYRGSLQR